MSEVCTHLDEVKLHELPASVDGCEDCLREGSKWLRRVRTASRAIRASLLHS
jgi:hypothetical protein